MMQTCPKCGFVQPEDKYCANCGLDIETYKPAPAPFFERFFGNTAVQIGFVVLIVIGITIAILLSQNRQVEKRLHSSVPQMPVATKPASKPETGPNVSRTQPKTAGNLPLAVKQQQIYQKLQNEHAKQKKVAAVAAPKEILIGFYEMSRASIMQLATEGQSLSETPESRSFILKMTRPYQQLREKEPGARQLGPIVRQRLHAGMPINLDYTRPTPTNSGMNGIGATFSLNPTKVSADEVELGLELVFNMRNKSGNSLITNEVNSTFSFSPKSTLVLSGYFPHRSVYRQDLMAFNGTPLAIFASPEFVNSVTDLVIVIKSK